MFCNMRQSKLFEAVHKNITKFETKLDNYIPPPTSPLQLSSTDKKEEQFAALARKCVDTVPKICTWIYMTESELEDLFHLTNKRDIRRTIDRKIGDEYPKGLSRLLLVELMYSVFQICKTSRMNLRQTGTLLSIFYLTHQYFSSSFDTTTEKTYKFFKEYILQHCVECPPDTMQIFSHSESKCVVSFFCTLYLRNLPLLKLLTLPNFGFTVQYKLPPEPVKSKNKSKDKSKGKKK